MSIYFKFDTESVKLWRVHLSSSFSNLMSDVCKAPPVCVISFRVVAINCATSLEDFFFQLFNSLAPELCLQRQTSQQLHSITKHDQSCTSFKAREVKSSIRGSLLANGVVYVVLHCGNDEYNYKRTRVSTAKPSPFEPHLSSFHLRIVPWAAASTENDREQTSAHRPNCL